METANNNTSSMAMTAQEIEQSLAQFIGTERYYTHNTPFLNIHYTDGVKFLVETCKAYWMLDVITSYQITANVRREAFQVHEFKSDGKGGMNYTLEDGNNNAIAKQHIPATDFPLDNITIWYSGKVAYLPSEH